MPHHNAHPAVDTAEQPTITPAPERPTSVKAALTTNPSPAPDGPHESRRAREVENPAFTAFVRRIIRAHGRRIAAGDVEGLRDLLTFADDLDAATHTAVTGLRRAGYSWAEIAERTGTTRQAAHQRWGHPRFDDVSPGVDTYASTDTTGEPA
jgi:pyruvate/2-oxoglutarate dehydrogenase complex dihydrolipoamide acyltransferase (E2) component